MLQPYKPSYYQRNVTEYNCEKFTGYSPQKLIGLTGIYGCTKDFSRLDTPIITGSYPIIEFCVRYKSVVIMANLNIRKSSIFNELVKIENETDRGKGTGFEILRSQIKYCMKAGLQTIQGRPWGDFTSIDQYNGYITWGKMGYIMEKKSQEKFNLLMSKHNRVETVLFELLQSEEGTEFWKINGGKWYGIFDLNLNSDSLRYFNHYAANKYKMKPIGLSQF